MPKDTRKPISVCADCGSCCWGRTRYGKQEVPRCHACANQAKPGAQCGSVGGYRRHLSRGEEACGVCREAARLAHRGYRESRKARGLLAQKRRKDRVYQTVELAHPDCTVCGKAILGRRLRAAEPMHNACRPRGRRSISRKVRLGVYERDGLTCQLCLRPVDLALPPADRWSATLDHIVAYSLGGSDDEDNLRLAHRSCNSRRGAMAA